MKDTGQEELLAARYRLADFNIEIAEQAFQAGGIDFPAGSWILPAQNGLIDGVRSTANDLGLDARFRTPICAMKISAPEACAIAWTSCSTDTWTSN